MTGAPDERLLPPGTSIADRFVIDGELGRGGMGTVYRGRQTLLDRPVAIKVMNRAMSLDPSLVERFVTEAKAAAALKHPNVVAVIDLGNDPVVGVFIALELLDGESLASRLAREGTLAPSVALALAGPVMEALDLAHGRGVVHRDVKPENVFLAKDHDGRVVPKLLDFGIARLVGDGAKSQTATGVVVGTPAYMSPEQCRARPEIGPATDVWAMGVVLYECLAGRLPFAGVSATDLIVSICTEQPSPLPPSLPAPIRDVIERALARDASARWPSMRAMLDALRAAVAASPDAPALARQPAAEVALAPTMAAGAVATPSAPRSVAKTVLEAPAAPPPARASSPAPGTAVAAPPRFPLGVAAAAALALGALGAFGLWSLTRATPEPAPPPPPLEVTPVAEDAATPPPVEIWPDGTTRWWRGTWTKPTSPSTFSFVLHLHRSGGAIDGVIDWTQETDQAPGIEWVHGSYQDGTLTFEGDQARGAVVTDAYRLTLEPDGMLHGATRTGEGDWAGVMTGVASGRTPPPAPFDVAAAPASAPTSPAGVASRSIGVSTATGARPVATDRVRIEYTVWTPDGVLVSSTYSHEAADETSVSSLLPALSEGVQTMRVGDRRRFWIPSGGGHDALVADVALLEIL